MWSRLFKGTILTSIYSIATTVHVGDIQQCNIIILYMSITVYMMGKSFVDKGNIHQVSIIHQYKYFGTICDMFKLKWQHFV